MHSLVTESQFRAVVEGESQHYDATNLELVYSGTEYFVALFPESKRVIKVHREGDVEPVIVHHHEINALATVDDLPFDKAYSSELHVDGTHPPYLVTEYVPGNHVRAEDFTEAQRYAYGEDIGRYALALNSSMSKREYMERHVAPCLADGVTSVAKVQQDFSEDRNVGGRFWPLANHSEFSRYPTLAGWLKWSYAVRQKYYPDSLENHRSEIVNSDARLENSLFNDANELTGLIDPRLIAGTLDLYTRGLHQIGASATEGFNDTMAMHGRRPVPAELAAFHGSLLQLTGVAILIQRNANSPKLSKLVDSLVRVLPEEDWSELDRFRYRAG